MYHIDVLQGVLSNLASPYFALCSHGMLRWQVAIADCAGEETGCVERLVQQYILLREKQLGCSGEHRAAVCSLFRAAIEEGYASVISFVLR